MNDHRPDDTLNESAIDREIKAALSVNPSPEFLARVRTRVANEPGPASWRWSWVATMASCVAVPLIVIAVVVVSRSGQQIVRTPAGQAPASPGPTAVRSTDGSALQPSATPLPSESTTDVALGVAPGVNPTEVVSGFSRTTDVSSGSVASGLPGRSVVESSRTEPEILIDPREARALRRLVDGVRVRRIDVSTLPLEVPQAMAVVQPLDDIAPIVIEPLEAAPVEGVRQ